MTKFVLSNPCRGIVSAEIEYFPKESWSPWRLCVSSSQYNPPCRWFKSAGGAKRAFTCGHVKPKEGKHIWVKTEVEGQPS
jgi:hypothetical protein